MSKIEPLKTGKLSIEKLILQGCIVDSSFLREMIEPLSLSNLESSEINISLKWIVDFYEKTKEAPQNDIKLLLDANKDSLDDEEFDVLYKIIRTTLKEYENKSFNRVYAKQKAIEYLKAKSLEETFNKGLFLLKKGMYTEAFELSLDRANTIQEKTTEIVNMHSKEHVKDWFFKTQEPDMRFRNILDDYLPPIQRGKYYGLYGRAKVGKSYWLLYFAQKGAEYGLKVFIVSCEMGEEEYQKRYTQMLMGVKFPKSAYEETTPYTTIPYFDCLKNQKGACEFSVGSNSPVQSDGNLIGPYEDFPKHKCCTKCVGTKQQSRFQPATWLKKEKVDIADFPSAMKAIENFSEHTSSHVKLKTYPIGTCTVDSVIADLDYLEDYEDFVPDLVVYDYPQIFKKRKNVDNRIAIGEIHEGLSSLAKSRGHIAFSGIQANRTGNTANRLNVDHLAEDISAIFTVDAIFAINSSDFGYSNPLETDRYWKRQRLETLLCRYEEFTPNRQLLTLENRDLGQIFLDGIITNAKE